MGNVKQWYKLTRTNGVREWATGLYGTQDIRYAYGTAGDCKAYIAAMQSIGRNYSVDNASGPDFTTFRCYWFHLADALPCVIDYIARGLDVDSGWPVECPPFIQ